MKTKHLLAFALFLTATVLVSGCRKPDTNLASENADLKARVQQLEQQLKESSSQAAAPGAQESQPASIQDLKSQLDEAQKTAAANANELKSVNSQLEAQKQKTDELTRELSKAQQAREKAEQALHPYQEAASALMQLQALRCTLPDYTLKLEGYQQNYVATQAAVMKLVDALPESGVRQAIVGVLATFTRINDTCEAAAQQMDARTKIARANYDKCVDFGGLGPNRYSIELGQDKILAPAQEDNAATASQRDQQILSLKKDLDLGLKKLQALLSVPGT